MKPWMGIALLLFATAALAADKPDYKVGDNPKTPYKETNWDAAPANEAMSGRNIRIAGFLVPLEWGDKKL